MAEALYDVVIVGAGPAGLAAALFAARRGLRVCVVTMDIGGQLALTDWIENYPGLLGATGRALVDQMLEQAKRDGAEVQMGEVERISQISNLKSQIAEWGLTLAEGDTLTTRTVILAFGLTPTPLGAEGEEALRGKGVYYAAVDDAPRQDGKVIAVVGGGDSAVTAALALAPRAAAVHLIHRRDILRAEQALQDRLAEHPNITLHLRRTVAEIRGTEHVESILLSPTDPETGSIRSDVNGHMAIVPLDSLFIQIGFQAKTKWLAGVVDLNDKNEVVTTRDCETSAPGIFAAGDLTNIAYKQAVVSAGEGTKAALQAFKYLQQQRGKPAVMLDWDVRDPSETSKPKTSKPI